MNAASSPTPFEGRSRWPEGARYRYRLGGHELDLFLRRVRPKTLEDVVTGEVDLALLVEGPAIALAFRFGPDGPWAVTAPFHWQLLPPSDRALPGELAPTSEGSSRLWSTLWITLVEARTGQVLARRAVALRPEFTRNLHQAIRQQALESVPDTRLDPSPAWLRQRPEDLVARARARTHCAAARPFGTKPSPTLPPDSGASPAAGGSPGPSGGTSRRTRTTRRRSCRSDPDASASNVPTSRVNPSVSKTLP